MPIYAYRCEACGFAKDVLQKMSDDTLTVCPSCGQDKFRKQVTAAGFQLKGSGWYVTDFRNGSGGAGKIAPGTTAGGENGGQGEGGASADSGSAGGTGEQATGNAAPAASAPAAGPTAAPASSAPSTSSTPSTPSSGAKPT